MRVRNPHRLRSRRTARKLTQRELAGLVGCTQQYLSALERGTDHDCSEKIALRIAKFLDVEVDDYFDTVQIRNTAVASSTRATRNAA